MKKGRMNMFAKDSAKPLMPVVPGVRRKTLAVGEHSLMTKFVLEFGSELPVHKHPHEQIGFLLSGRLILTIGEESCDMEPGDSWAIPGDVEHSAKVIERAEAIEVFTPVRQDYL
jgi:quercetin dioxygenase-like cupin family protein